MMNGGKKPLVNEQSLPSISCFVDDLNYYLEHYDPVMGMSHQRYEQWGLGWAILDALEFNLPLMMKKIEVVPERLFHQAEKDLSGSSGEVASRRRILRRARQVWGKELRSLYEAVVLYRHYADEGIVNRGQPLKRLARSLLSVRLPKAPLSAAELRRRRDKYWLLWTSLYQKVGRELWN